jgi:hypothetical protein
MLTCSSGLSQADNVSLCQACRESEREREREREGEREDDDGEDDIAASLLDMPKP